MIKDVCAFYAAQKKRAGKKPATKPAKKKRYFVLASADRFGIFKKEEQISPLFVLMRQLIVTNKKGRKIDVIIILKSKLRLNSVMISII